MCRVVNIEIGDDVLDGAIDVLSGTECCVDGPDQFHFLVRVKLGDLGLHGITGEPGTSSDL